jgi:hypothetical protein
MCADTHPDPARDIAPPSWWDFRDAFENPPADRSAARRQVGVWAADRLSERLGEEWPQRTFSALGQLPGGMKWAGIHMVTYAKFVELALWLELLCSCEGFARVRDALKQDPREEQILHLRLQLEVGALAASAGYRVQFERPIPDSLKKSDITIDLAEGKSLLVEAQVVLQDQSTVVINNFTDKAFRAIQDIRMTHEVDCSGDLKEVLNDTDLADLLDVIEKHARLVKAGGVTPRLVLHGASLQVSPRESRPDRALRGPKRTGDVWPRIAGRLDQKARQTEGGQNVWLRICPLQGLWPFTPWGQLGLPDKLASMRQNIASGLARHSHVDGVVISSASGWPQGTINPDEYADDAGGYALRCAIPPIRARETLIIPLNAKPDTIDHASLWRDLYVSEPDWLDHALRTFDLPSTTEIFAASDEGDA